MLSDPASDPDLDPDPDPVSELLALLLDQLAPALVAYHREVARRLELHPVELACLDELRRAAGSVPSADIGRRTGLTRSSVAKMVRRLEERGHLDRVVRPGEQAVESVLRPHPARDAERARLEAELRRGIEEVIVRNRLHRDGDHRAMATWTAAAARLLGWTAWRLAAEAGDARLLATRRRARQAAGWDDGGVRW